MMDKKRALGLRIKELRKINKYTQDKLAELVDIDPKHLSRIENGRNFPSMETLEKLVVSLNITFSDLFKFNHFESRDSLINSISANLKSLPDKKLKFVYKIIKELY